MIAASSPPQGEPVLVVGAGPAGATAARTLALGGVPVRLLDRSAFPRNKPCGGGISLRATRRFPYLNDALPRIATHFVGRLHLEGPGGESTVIESDGPAALMVRRVEFDALLVSLAVEAGAELVAGADVVRAADSGGIVSLSTRDGRTFTSSTVVAADGVHSTVARRLGLNPGWPATAVALDMMEETPRAALRDVDPSTLWVAYGYSPVDGSPTRAAPEGYAYIFPKRDHVNVGVGYVLQYYRAHVDASPYDLQRRFVDRLRARGIVDGASVRENFTPFLIPVGGPLRSPGRGGVLLAGDAGGFVNAFTAEGIYYAMVSGDLAARAIIESRRHGGDQAELAARYASACGDEMGAELRDSVLIQQYLFRDNTRIRAVIEGAPRSMLTRMILDFVVGRMSYHRLRRRLFTRAPGLAARLAWELLRKKTWPRASAAAII